MKILIAGDSRIESDLSHEATLACVVRIVRAAAPTAKLTLATEIPERAARLGLQSAPDFDFESPDDKEFQRLLLAHDFFLWAGVHPLSDFPEGMCRLLAAVREADCRSILWNIEMRPGFSSDIQQSPLAVAETVDALTGGRFAFQSHWRNKREAALRASLAEELLQCSLLVTRNPRSTTELIRCGIPKNLIVTAADSRLIQPDAPWPPPLSESDLALFARPDIRRIVLSLSPEPDTPHWEEWIETIDALLLQEDLEMLALPVNPTTDLPLLQHLRHEVARRDKFHVLTGDFRPADMASLIARTNLVISNRLYPLLLATLHQIPLLGIGTHPEVKDLLALFDLEPVSGHTARALPELDKKVAALLDSQADFVLRSKKIRTDLLATLDSARHLLRATFQSPRA